MEWALKFIYYLYRVCVCANVWIRTMRKSRQYRPYYADGDVDVYGLPSLDTKRDSAPDAAPADDSESLILFHEKVVI